MEVKNPPIVIVGCGPGSAEYVTPLARRAAEQAEVLVGASRLLDLFPDHPGERVVAGANVEKILAQIDARRQHQRIAVLVTGDPGACSLALPVLKRFGRQACEVIPGISSIQVAFSRIGLDWVDARIIDAHGARPEIEPRSVMDRAKIAVLAGKPESFEWVAHLAGILGKGYRLFACENLTLPDERIRSVEPADLDGMDISSKTVFLLIRKALLK